MATQETERKRMRPRSGGRQRRGGILWTAMVAWWTFGALQGLPVGAQEGPLTTMSVTTEPSSFVNGERLVYVVTLQNTGLVRLDGAAIWTSVPTNSNRRADLADCRPENSRWQEHPDGTWVQTFGSIAPGEKRIVRFCVVPESIGSCEATQNFDGSVTATRGNTSTLRFDHAIATVPGASCSNPCFAAPGGDNTRTACCVAEAINCLFQPSDPLCGGTTSPTPSLLQLASRALEAGSRFFGVATDIRRLYALRDVLRTTPGGRAAVTLYTAHQGELRRLLLDDATLRERAIDVLTAWSPVIDDAISLIGPEATITRAQIDELESFLDELRAVASPGLRATIDRESQALGIEAFAGLSARQASGRLNKLTCAPDAQTLCLSQGRIRVETTWETRDGQRGRGRAVPLTSDTGTFWFFSAANVETIVKALDACSFNDRRWFFAAGLTDVGVETTVTDTATGVVKSYRNPLGRPYAAVQDTDAFDCTP